MRRIFFILCILFFSRVSFAQMTDKIETDRPDQTESPYTVPKRFLQGEFGFNLMKYDGDLQQIFHPTSLLKYGLNTRLELRLEATPYTEKIAIAPNSRKELKLEPVEIGAKVRLFEERGWRPKTSVIAHVGMPFLASKEFQHSPLAYTARLTMQNTFTELLALGYNIGVERDADATSSLFYTFAPGFDINKKWYAYVEAFGSFSSNEDEHNLDGGIAFYPSPDAKIDVSGGFGLGSSPLKNYVALGFSFRLPLRR